MVTVDETEDSLVLDVRDVIGAYVKITAGEAVVVFVIVTAGVGGQIVVNGDGKVTTAGFKLCEEEDLVDNTDNDAIVIVLVDEGVIVTPHVQIDAHVQTDEHVHEKADAWVQDTVVASECDGIAPGGNERVRGEVGRCEEDNTVESCDQVDSSTSEDDVVDVEEHGVDDNGVGGSTSDDDKDDRVDNTRDTGGS